MKKYALVLAMLFLNAPAVHAGQAVFEKQALAVLESVPVQHGGRVKPFKSYAQETLLYLTGRMSFDGEPASSVLFQCMAHPEDWYTKPFFPVSYEALRKELGLLVIQKRISAELLLNHEPFVKAAKAAAKKKEEGDPLTTLEDKQLELYSKASYFNAILSHGVPGMIPNPPGVSEGWMPPEFLSVPDKTRILAQLFPSAPLMRAIQAQGSLFESIRQAPSGGKVTLAAAQEYADAMEELTRVSRVAIDRGLIRKEMVYLNFQPFHLAWILYLVSFAFMLLGRTRALRPLSWAGLAVFLGALGVHTFGFYLRVVIAGRPPVSNMYESMIWVAWVAAVLSVLSFLFYRTFTVLITAGPVAALVLFLAQRFPVVFTPVIDTLVPVLRSNLWLTVHVLTITMSYGVFALAWGMGHVIVFRSALEPSGVRNFAQLSQLLHRILMMGVVLLAAGTILGGVWANYSWGRFWGWDPKETWALIALLGYLAVLHGRFAGWFGDFGIAAGSVAAFLGIVMAWYGVNYVLAAGLHSYGFGGGGAGYVLGAALLDLTFVAACVLRYRQKPRLAAR